jgi:hypothetical protein
MHVVARGALIGGGVGAALAVLRRGEAEGRAGRIVRSAAEGALAGAAVGFLLDRPLRARAVELVVDAADRAPAIVETVADTIVDVAIPQVVRLADLAKERAADLRAA